MLCVMLPGLMFRELQFQQRWLIPELRHNNKAVAETETAGRPGC